LVAASYSSELAGVGDIVLPAVAADSEPVWHLYVLRTADPSALTGFLAERGIGTGRHYPEPIHLSRAYASLGYTAGQFPVSERLAKEALSLPLFAGMQEEQVDRVVRAVRDYFSG
jgi:dTDP-4-amino-4,6-dideoxygalactose transaminase